MFKIPNLGAAVPQHIQEQHKLINEWKPEREVWSLKYGNHIIAVLAGINGVIINTMFRRPLQLRHYGFKFTMLFLSTGPALAAYSCHKCLITENLILYRPKCITCEELKASALFEANTLIYSLIISPTINLAIAGSIGYRIPYIYEAKELLKFWWSVVRPQARILSIMFFSNMAVASAVTYLQITSMEKISNIVLKINKYIENKENTGIDPEPSNTNSLLQ